MRAPVLILIGLMAVSTAPAAEQAPPASGAPETFSAKAEAQRGAGAVSATMQISITRYSSDFDRTNVETGLKHGGYPGFLTALRKASVVGSVAIGDNKFAIRWAREQKAATGRAIVVITDKPVFFIGGGQAESKPRAGYEVGVIQLLVDDSGVGTGTMAAAARVKPGGDAGVQVDDYGEGAIKLVSVTRKTP